MVPARAGGVATEGARAKMAWIESHQSLGRHPKLFRLASKLRINKAQAIGHLQYLWWWALDFAPTGNLSAFTSAEISAGAEWPGEPGPFHEALCDCVWIDPDGMIHDWLRISRRYKRLKWQRATHLRRARIANLPNTLTADEWNEIVNYFSSRCAYCHSFVANPVIEHIEPVVRGGGTTAENVVPSCQGCNQRKHAKSLLEFVSGARFHGGN